MGFWQKLKSVSDQYAEVTHCTDGLLFIDMAKKILNQCMTNCAYIYQGYVQIKPFKSYSREYLKRGLELLDDANLNQEEQFKVVIGTLLAAKYYNDQCYADDIYYRSNPWHLSSEMKDSIKLLLEPYEGKEIFTAEEQCADCSNKINVLSDAVFNEELDLDESFFIKSSLISAEPFNLKLKELCEVYDIKLSLEEQSQIPAGPR
ncbi:hypothetical protein [Legionella sp. 16cNR16C]|uniref:hypothetical protein n=1 Tax=Legionella sp. 16cNR16C TaxID=2905656 RepID=UPI001E5736AD|nr:hypothetical protein [Legionella sp. 16cNR16C]MCE3045858.1 hypothetical protein [Legionella sp. 16cNR16C]